MSDWDSETSETETDIELKECTSEMEEEEEYDPATAGVQASIDLTQVAAAAPTEGTTSSELTHDVVTMPVGSRTTRKDWVFTWNNPTGNPEELWKDTFNYLIYQVEEAPETGTRHVQGFIQFKKEKRLTALKKLEKTVHWEGRRGSVQQCIDYCSKEATRVEGGGPFEFGERPRFSGQRSDLTKLGEELLSGKKHLREVVFEHPSEALRYSKGFQFLSRYAKAPKMKREVEVRLYLGTTRLGKTWDAVSEFSEDDTYVKDTTNWWDNYQGQPYVVMDDFCGAASHTTVVELLRLLDNYRYQVPVKGSFEWLCAKVIIITSNIHPIKWYDWKDRMEQYDALIARLDVVRIYKPPRGTFTEYVGADAIKKWDQEGH